MAIRNVVRGWKAAAKVNGKSEAQTRRDVMGGLFPVPVKVGRNSVAWFEDELEAHQENLERVAYAPALDEQGTPPEPLEAA